MALLVELVAAAVALPFLWLAHATWLSPGRAGERRRTPIAMLTFFAVGLVRLFAMFGTRWVLDIEQPWSPWQALITGGVYSVVVLSVVAVVVNAVRSHAELIADMRQAEETLARARQLDADEAESLQRTYVEEVLRELRTGIGRLAERRDRVAMAEELRAMSEELVRPGSHFLRDGEAVSRAVAAPRSRVRLVDVVHEVRPAAPVLGPIGFEALVFTAVLRDLGLTIASINAVVATLTFIGCNLIVQRVAQRHWPRRLRVLTLVAINLAIGLLAGALVVGVMGAVLGQQAPALWVGSVTYAVFMLFFSLVSSLRREQRQMERALAASLADQAEELGRVRQLVAEQRARLSHLMHGGLQAELTASALTLSREWGNAEPQREPDDIVAGLLAEIDRQQVAIDTAPHALDLEDLFDTWRLAMDLEVDCDLAVTDQLSRDAELRTRVTDVVSEALTNAVRHGTERQASVVMSVDSDRTILLTVSNPGRLTGIPLGMGSDELDEFCLEWSRSERENSVILTARLSGTIADIRARSGTA
jgi:signal transduction histidine kinase